MSARRGPEQRLQISLVEWLAVALPPPPQGPTWTAINPVPSKSRAAAGLSRAMGLRAGWPDLVFVLPGGRALGVEVKVKGGGLSRGQRDMRNTLSSLGAAVYVVRSIEDLADVLRREGVEVRAM